MPAVVVDTNIVSFEFKRDTRTQLYHSHLAGKLLVISFMTLAELDLWALERGPSRKIRMERHIRQYVIYPFDRGLCLKWAEASRSARSKGRPIHPADGWIAATALTLWRPPGNTQPAPVRTRCGHGEQPKEIGK